MDRDVKWKKYVTASCTLGITISCQLLSEAGVPSLGHLVPCTSSFHVFIKMYLKYPRESLDHTVLTTHGWRNFMDGPSILKPITRRAFFLISNLMPAFSLISIKYFYNKLLVANSLWSLFLTRVMNCHESTGKDVLKLCNLGNARFNVDVAVNECVPHQYRQKVWISLHHFE